MSSRSLALLFAGALLCMGSPAQAAPVQTTATLTVDLGALGSFAITGSGTVDVSGSGSISAVTTGGAPISGSQIAVPGGLVLLPTTVTINLTPNQTTLVTKIILNPGLGNATGTFVSGFVPAAGEQCPVPGDQACVVGGGRGGIMPVVGTVTALVGINLANFGIGVGGGASGLIAGEGAPFTTQTGQAVSVNGNVSSAVGSSADPITFVTPVAVNAFGNSLAIFAQFSLSGIGVAVPEPGTLLLLGAGIAGLAVASRRNV